MLKLTKIQKNALKWLQGGHQPRLAYRSTVEVNGRFLCTTITMAVLERHGLARKVDEFRGATLWEVTAAGKEVEL